MENSPIQQEASSFRDPSGHLFHQNGILYRQVNQRYSDDYNLLKSSGLYDSLVKTGSLIPHEEFSPIDLEISDSSAWKVLKPEFIPFISYPYEWAFDFYKEAALCTLQIQEKALDHGMTLKDASAYNIQFHLGKATFIDTLSFSKYEEGTPWVAYKQYCQHFLAPLTLMSKIGLDSGLMMRDFIDGIPLDLTCRMLPFKTRLSLGLLMHLFLHAGSQSKHADNKRSAQSTKVSLHSLKGMIDSLKNTITKLELPKALRSEWSNYDQTHNYTSTAHDEKARLVEDYLKQVSPDTVWDIGANTGDYSRIACQHSKLTVGFDIDPLCVQMLFHSVKQQKQTNLLPVTMNFANPSPGLGWAGEERASLASRGPADLLMALAVVHHLAIVNNVPLDRIARYFSELGKHLIIEWVPKSDSQIQLMLKNREDIFHSYNEEDFEKHFSNYFTIERKELIRESQRHLYLMKVK
ncbi:SAM-dependent methyltransferase [Verrucomicrobia bacterium]|nr:SAM-dependent methyltransferase [Verrucomicrobiota bacterium]